MIFPVSQYYLHAEDVNVKIYVPILPVLNFSNFSFPTTIVSSYLTRGLKSFELLPNCHF